MVSDDMDFSLGGHPPDEYMSAIEEHTQDVLQNVEQELSAEEEIKQQVEEIEKLDQGVVNDLRDVLDIFSTYVGDMERFTVFVVNKAQNEGVTNSAEIFGQLTDEVSNGNLQFEHSMTDVLKNIQKVHNDLKDAFERLREKDEKLSEIENELEQIAGEDRDLEKELGAIENMVDHMGRMAVVYEEVSHDVDPSKFDFTH